MVRENYRWKEHAYILNEMSLFGLSEEIRCGQQMSNKAWK